MAFIIAIDDQEEWRQLHEQVLSGAGHTVHAFADGRTVLRSVDARPDVIVLDLRMYPTGRQLLGSLRRKWRGVPIVICSAYDGFRDDPDFHDVAAFVAKSSDGGELLRAVQSALAPGVAASGDCEP